MSTFIVTYRAYITKIVLHHKNKESIEEPIAIDEMPCLQGSQSGRDHDIYFCSLEKREVFLHLLMMDRVLLYNLFDRGYATTSKHLRESSLNVDSDLNGVRTPSVFLV